MELREYQTNALTAAKQKLEQYGRGIIVAPCAAGKTVMFSP
jgi:superfamily II DNA or RNA helicase